MKETGSVWTLVLVGLVLALVVAVGLSVWLIGSDRLFILAAVLVGGLVLALLVGAASLPIRAWRRSDANPIIEHHYHEGRQIIRERVIDGRPIPPPQLPAPAQPPLGVFPELLRASYQAGLLQSPRGETVDAEVRDVTPDEWAGDITP